MIGGVCFGGLHPELVERSAIALQRRACKILTSQGNRLARLSVELGALLTELLLQRQPLLVDQQPASQERQEGIGDIATACAEDDKPV